MIEPVFGQIKENRGIRRFQRRGFQAGASEWQLIAATHNLRKLYPPHSAPRLAGALRPPLTQTAHAASPRPLVQPGPTPPRPRPMPTRTPFSQTTPRRLTTTAPDAKLRATASARACSLYFVMKCMQARRIWLR